jgi:hypothetical protein
MDKRRGFPALHRRRRYLEQEVYTYEKWMRDGKDIDAATQHRMALAAGDHSEELDELETILQFMEQLANGYHLSRLQWTLLLSAVVASMILTIMAAMR